MPNEKVKALFSSGLTPESVQYAYEEPDYGRFTVESLKQIPIGVVQSAARAIRNIPSSIPGIDYEQDPSKSNILERLLIEKPTASQERYMQRYAQPGMKTQTVAQSMQSLGYSGATAAAAAGAAIAIGGTGLLATGAALAGGYTVAYGATRDQKLEELYNYANDVIGRKLSGDEWKRIVELNDFENVARAYGNYEAIPEVLADVLGYKLLRGTAKLIPSKWVRGKLISAGAAVMPTGAREAVSTAIAGIMPSPKTAIGKVLIGAGRMGKIQVTENIQELYTNYRQAQIDAGIYGLEDPTLTGVFKDTAPSVALTTTILGIAGLGGGKAYDYLHMSRIDEAKDGSKYIASFKSALTEGKFATEDEAVEVARKYRKHGKTVIAGEMDKLIDIRFRKPAEVVREETRREDATQTAEDALANLERAKIQQQEQAKITYKDVTSRIEPSEDIETVAEFDNNVKAEEFAIKNNGIVVKSRVVPGKWEVYYRTKKSTREEFFDILQKETGIIPETQEQNWLESQIEQQEQVRKQAELEETFAGMPEELPITPEEEAEYLKQHYKSLEGQQPLETVPTFHKKYIKALKQKGRVGAVTKIVNNKGKVIYIARITKPKPTIINHAAERTGYQTNENIGTLAQMVFPDAENETDAVAQFEGKVVDDNWLASSIPTVDESGNKTRKTVDTDIATNEELLAVHQRLAMNLGKQWKKLQSGKNVTADDVQIFRETRDAYNNAHREMLSRNLITGKEAGEEGLAGVAEVVPPVTPAAPTVPTTAVAPPIPEAITTRGRKQRPTTKQETIRQQSQEASAKVVTTAVDTFADNITSILKKKVEYLSTDLQSMQDSATKEALDISVALAETGDIIGRLLNKVDVMFKTGRITKSVYSKAKKEINGFAETYRTVQEAGKVVVTKETIPSEEVEVTPTIKSRFNEMLNRWKKRSVMEAEGQFILDALEENNISPRDVSDKFWTETYPLLPDAAKERFQIMLTGVTGIKPGDVMLYNPDTKEEIIAKDWVDVARNADLPNTVEYLEGTERGYVALMNEGNRRFLQDRKLIEAPIITETTTHLITIPEITATQELIDNLINKADESQKGKTVSRIKKALPALINVEGIEDLESLIDDYHNITREGMTPEEYAEEKESAYNEVIDALEGLEVVGEMIEAEVAETPAVTKPATAAKLIEEAPLLTQRERDNRKGLLALMMRHNEISHRQKTGKTTYTDRKTGKKVTKAGLSKTDKQELKTTAQMILSLKKDYKIKDDEYARFIRWIEKKNNKFAIVPQSKNVRAMVYKLRGEESKQQKQVTVPAITTSIVEPETTTAVSEPVSNQAIVDTINSINDSFRTGELSSIPMQTINRIRTDLSVMKEETERGGFVQYNMRLKYIGDTVDIALTNNQISEEQANTIRSAVGALNRTAVVTPTKLTAVINKINGKKQEKQAKQKKATRKEPTITVIPEVKPYISDSYEGLDSTDTSITATETTIPEGYDANETGINMESGILNDPIDVMSDAELKLVDMVKNGETHPVTTPLNNIQISMVLSGSYSAQTGKTNKSNDKIGKPIQMQLVEDEKGMVSDRIYSINRPYGKLYFNAVTKQLAADIGFGVGEIARSGDVQFSDVGLTEEETNRFEEDIRLQTIFAIGGIPTPEIIQEHVDKLKQAYNTDNLGVDVHIIRTVEEIPEQYIQDVIYANRNRERFETVGAILVRDVNTNKHTLYIMSNNVQNIDNIYKIFRHELVGHLGLHRVFGDKLDPLLDEVYKYALVNYVDEIKQIGLRYTLQDTNTAEGMKQHDTAEMTDPDFQRRIANEILAELNTPAYADIETNFLERVYGFIRRLFINLMASVGIYDRNAIIMSHGEIRHILERSREAIMNNRASSLGLDFASDVILFGSPVRSQMGYTFGVNAIPTIKDVMASGQIPDNMKSLAYGLYFKGAKAVGDYYAKKNNMVSHIIIRNNDTIPMNRLFEDIKLGDDFLLKNTGELTDEERGQIKDKLISMIDDKVTTISEWLENPAMQKGMRPLLLAELDRLKDVITDINNSDFAVERPVAASTSTLHKDRLPADYRYIDYDKRVPSNQQEIILSQMRKEEIPEILLYIQAGSTKLQNINQKIHNAVLQKGTGTFSFTDINTRETYTVKNWSAEEIEKNADAEERFTETHKPASDKVQEAIKKDASLTRLALYKGTELTNIFYNTNTVTDFVYSAMTPKANYVNSRISGRDIYRNLNSALGSQREASIFLLRANIDGMRVSNPVVTDINDDGYYNYMVFDTDAVTFEDQVQMMMNDTENGRYSKEVLEFFRDSKIRDADGNLMAVYHGTVAPENFSEFNVGIPREITGEEGQVEYGSGQDVTTYLGSHFTNNPKVAGKFAKGLYSRVETGGGRIYPVYLNLKNPIIYNTDLELYNTALSLPSDSFLVDDELAINDYKDADEYEKNPEFTMDFNIHLLDKLRDSEGNIDQELAIDLANNLRSQLESQGYDGIIYTNTVEGGIGYIAFNSNQIKSIYNSAPTLSSDIMFMHSNNPSDILNTDPDEVTNKIQNVRQEYETQVIKKASEYFMYQKKPIMKPDNVTIIPTEQQKTRLIDSLSHLFPNVIFSDEQLYDENNKPVNARLNKETYILELSPDIDTSTIGHEAVELMILKLGVSHPVIQRGLAIFNGNKEQLGDAVGKYHAGITLEENLLQKLINWLKEVYVAFKDATGMELSQNDIITMINGMTKTIGKYDTSTVTMRLKSIDMLSNRLADINLNQLPTTNLPKEEVIHMQYIAQLFKDEGKKIITSKEFSDRLIGELIEVRIEPEMRQIYSRVKRDIFSKNMKNKLKHLSDSTINIDNIYGKYPDGTTYKVTYNRNAPHPFFTITTENHIGHYTSMYSAIDHLVDELNIHIGQLEPFMLGGRFAPPELGYNPNTHHRLMFESSINLKIPAHEAASIMSVTALGWAEIAEKLDDSTVLMVFEAQPSDGIKENLHYTEYREPTIRYNYNEFKDTLQTKGEQIILPSSIINIPNTEVWLELDETTGGIVLGYTPFEYSEEQNIILSKPYKTIDELIEGEISPSRKLSTVELMGKKINYFLYRALIQDATRKGYKKIMFPIGNTIAVIEKTSAPTELYNRVADKIFKEYKERARNITVAQYNWLEITLQPSDAVTGSYVYQRRQNDTPESIGGRIHEDFKSGKTTIEGLESMNPNVDFSLNTIGKIVHNLDEADKGFIPTTFRFMQDQWEGFKNRKEGRLPKPELTLLEEILSSVEWYAYKYPASRKIFESVLEHVSERYQVSSRILQYDPVLNRSLASDIEDLETHNPAEYNKVNELMLRDDRNKLDRGATARLEYDKLNDELLDAKFRVGDEANKDKETQGGIHREIRMIEDKIELARINIEVEQTASLRQEGLSEEGIRVWLSARRIFENALQELINYGKVIIKQYEKDGRMVPEYIYKDDSGRNQKINLRKALKSMGELIGSYFPRMRTPGGIKLHINKQIAKDGTTLPAITKLYTSDIARATDVAKFRREGYTITDDSFSLVEYSPEDAVNFLSNITTIEDALNRVVNGMSGSIRSVADAPGISLAGMHDYVKADGTIEQQFIVQTDSQQYRNIFRESGLTAQYYELQRGSEQKAWRFKGDQSTIEQRVLDVINQNAPALSSMKDEFLVALVLDMTDMLKAGGYRSSTIRRGPQIGEDVVLGYEEDLSSVAAAYTDKIARGISKAEMIYKTLGALHGQYDENGELIEAKNFENYADYLARLRENKIDPISQRRLYKAMVRYIGDQIRSGDNIDRMIGKLKSVAVLKYMAGPNIIASPVVNLTNFFTGIPAAMSLYGDIKIRSTPKLLYDALIHYKNYKLMQGAKTSEERARYASRIPVDVRLLLDIIKEKGWDVAQFNQEHLVMLQSKAGKYYNWMMLKSMWLFGRTEESLRVASIVGAYMGMRNNAGIGTKLDISKDKSGKIVVRGQLGLGDIIEKLYNKAEFISNRANALYGKVASPSYTQGPSMGAKLLRAGYTFLKFPHNYLNLIWASIQYDIDDVNKLYSKLPMGERIKKQFTREHMHGKKSAMYLMMAPTVLAGVGANPVYEITGPIFNWILQAFFGADDPEEAIYQWLQDNGNFWNEFAQGGIVGAVSPVSLKRSLAIEVPTLKSNIVASMLGDVSSFYKYAKTGDWTRAGGRLLPRAIGSVERARREYKYGATTSGGVPIFYGDKQIRPSLAEAIGMATGFTPSTTSRMKEEVFRDQELYNRYQEERRNIYTRFRRYWGLSSNKRTAKELTGLLKLKKEYNDNVRRKRLRDKRYYGIELMTDAGMRVARRGMEEPSKMQKARQMELNR